MTADVQPLRRLCAISLSLLGRKVLGFRHWTRGVLTGDTWSDVVSYHFSAGPPYGQSLRAHSSR